ncbi:hypothetical protein FRB90_002855 [Tulasnella sp. 427]|nr:hypothetical protein FRB90_002855 [Tulasnella sp. 427]
MIFPYSSDLNASSASTRMSSNSPSSISSDSTVDSVPFDLFPSNDIQTQAQGAWPVNDPNAYLAYLSQLALQQPVEEVMVVPTSPSTPIVQMHNMSLSSSPTSSWSAYAPCGQVTYAPTSAIVAPRPVPSSSPLIGSGWSTTFQSPPIVNHSSPSQSPPARPAMQFKLPPQKGRKSFPCPERDCHMTFPKNNALVQVSAHTSSLF